MYLIEKIVIKDGVNADTTVTINKYTGEVDAINTLLAHPNIPNTRGIANYSVIGNKPTFGFSGVGANEMWVYINGVGFTPGGITTLNPNDFYFYDGIVSTTTLGADYNQVKVLVVNELGNYKVGNVVKLRAKHVALGITYYTTYFGEITNIEFGTNAISVSLINAGTNYTPPSSEWTFSLVANDYDGLEFILFPYQKRKQNAPFIWTPSSTETKNLESDFGATGDARQIIVVGSNPSAAYTIDIKVLSINEYEIYTIIQASPHTYNPLTIITSGGTFWDTTTSKTLHPNKGADIANNEFKHSIRIIKIGTLIYVI